MYAPTHRSNNSTNPPTIIGKALGLSVLAMERDSSLGAWLKRAASPFLGRFEIERLQIDRLTAGMNIHRHSARREREKINEGIFALVIRTVDLRQLGKSSEIP